IFRPYLARLYHRGSPELSALSAIGNGTPRLHSIDDGSGIHGAPGLFIGKDPLQLPERLQALTKLRVGQQQAFGPIHLHNSVDSKSRWTTSINHFLTGGKKPLGI